MHPNVYVYPGVLVSQVLMLRALKRCLQLISFRGALYRCRFNGVWDIDSQVPQLWDIDSCQKLQPAHAMWQKIKANLRVEQLFVHISFARATPWSSWPRAVQWVTLDVDALALECVCTPSNPATTPPVSLRTGAGAAEARRRWPPQAFPALVSHLLLRCCCCLRTLQPSAAAAAAANERMTELSAVCQCWAGR